MFFDLEVTLPCCMFLCVSIPSPSPLSHKQKSLSLQTLGGFSAACVTTALECGTTAPRYYRTQFGTTAVSREVKTEGVRGSSPHIHSVSSLPHLAAAGPPRGTLPGVPHPCHPSKFSSGGINPHPLRVPWTPVLPFYFLSLAHFS